MSTVCENVEYSSPKQNSKHEEIAEYNGPKHNTKHDAQHPPTLYTSKSLNLRKYDFHLTICCFRKLEAAAAIFFGVYVTCVRVFICEIVQESTYHDLSWRKIVSRINVLYLYVLTSFFYPYQAQNFLHDWKPKISLQVAKVGKEQKYRLKYVHQHFPLQILLLPHEKCTRLFKGDFGEPKSSP